MSGKRFALLLLILATVGCDHVTKRFAAEVLSTSPTRSFMNDAIRFEYAENTGGFLGLGAEWPALARTGVFTIGNALLLAALAVAAVRARWSGAAVVGITLVVAGGVSNLVDRLVRGSVIDFVSIGVGPFRTGIFNVADMAVMLGAALVLVATLRSRHDAPASPEGGRHAEHTLDSPDHVRDRDDDDQRHAAAERTQPGVHDGVLPGPSRADDDR